MLRRAGDGETTGETLARRYGVDMDSRPLFFVHPSSLEHDTGGHPEGIARMITLIAAMEQHDYLGWEPVSSPAVPRAVLERVHAAAYVDALERIARRGGGELDDDTVMSAGSFVAALHAVGGAVEMVRRIVERGGGGALGFSAHRPPGHHATGNRAAGFCMFNNVAVAAQYALDELAVERVMVLDWDVHHGNGTQDIFWGTDRVLFVSIHQWPLYPGTGRSSEIGTADGHGHTVNLPVPPGSGDETFVSMVRDVALPLALAYEPRLLLLSAGFDAHRDDFLADCVVSEAGFATMAAIWRDLAYQLDVPLGVVLEGGYEPVTLARCVLSTMDALRGEPGSGPAQEPLASCPPARLATDAAARLTRLWPELTIG